MNKMNKKVKVIKINGIKGIIVALFMLCCLFTGFLMFPGWLCMNIWNYITNFINIPRMEIIHGVILWLIIGLSYYVITSEKGPVVGFYEAKSFEESNSNINEILSKIKSQSNNQTNIEIINQDKNQHLENTSDKNQAK